MGSEFVWALVGSIVGSIDRLGKTKVDVVVCVDFVILVKSFSSAALIALALRRGHS